MEDNMADKNRQPWEEKQLAAEKHVDGLVKSLAALDEMRKLSRAVDCIVAKASVAALDAHGISHNTRWRNWSWSIWTQGDKNLFAWVNT